MKRIDILLAKKDKTPWERALLSPLHLLSLPYGMGVRLRTLLFGLGLLRTKKLPCPVISVGNLTAGGTGKTPLVMWLAESLFEKGVPVAILTRGYKREKAAESLLSDGKSVFLSREESGDEPYLMAQLLRQVPIFVGKDRFRNGQQALEKFGVQGVILDDGFQHLSLRRDLDIVLIDASLGFGDGHLLPRGMLREPLRHLRRAHLFMLTKVEDREACEPLETRLHEIRPAPVFHSHFEAMGFIGPRGEAMDCRAFQGKRIIALSGVGNPGYFSSLLSKLGINVVREVIYPDHHVYTAKEVTSLAGTMKGVDGIVTTEKDMVKLVDLEAAHLPVWALRIRFKIWEQEEFLKLVLGVCRSTSDNDDGRKIQLHRTRQDQRS
jgi:tetraacyldisaccharide 4'-kinase